MSLPPPPPPPPDPAVTTLKRLRTWMARHGYHHRTIAVGQALVEGHALRHGPYGVEWVYCERGLEQIEQVFQNEAEAAQFGLETLRNSLTAREHLLGFFDAKGPRDALIATLEVRGIAHRHDSIPYGGPDDPRYRVFVWGRDIDRCADLSQPPSPHGR